MAKDSPERMLWMVGFVVCAGFAIRTESLRATVLYAAAAGYCFKQAA